MESKEPNIEEIEKYVTGQMSAFDAGLFEVRMSNDEILREQTESLRMAIEVSKQYRAHELKLYIQKHAPKEYKNTFWQTTIIYAVAASLVLLSVSYGILLYFDKDLKQVAQGVKLKDGSKHDSPSRLNRNREFNKNEIDSIREIDNNVIATEKPDFANDSMAIYDSKAELANTTTVSKDMAGKMVEDVPASVEAGDNFKVQSDELVLDTNITTYFAMEVVNLEKKALKKKSMTLPQQSNNTYKGNNQSPSSNRADNNNESDKSIEYKPQQMLNVEFWKSPVNYKGYRYNTKKLIVYGMKTSDFTLIKVKGVLYIKSAGFYYKIEENDRFNNFWPEAISPAEE